jgi:hypothetical protein
MTDKTTELREFTVSIEWRGRPQNDSYNIVARSAADAIEIATRVFWRSHIPECSIDTIKIVGEDNG